MSAVSPLAGDAVSLIIRALLDFRSLWTTHDLVTTTGVPAQTIRRVVNRLEREELVERQAPGVIAVPSWLTLLRRWTEDVRFSRDVRLTYWRSQHGAQPLLDRVATTPVRHAVSGARAAQVWAPETPLGPTVIYTPDARAAATVWELVPARGRAIILAEPSGDVAYTRSRKTDSGLRLAAPVQVLADLLTGAASAGGAEPLTHWMLQHELEWRY